MSRRYYVHSDYFCELEKKEQLQIIKQLVFMEGYKDALSERLFNKGD